MSLLWWTNVQWVLTTQQGTHNMWALISQHWNWVVSHMYTQIDLLLTPTLNKAHMLCISSCAILSELKMPWGLQSSELTQDKLLVYIYIYRHQM